MCCSVKSHCHNNSVNLFEKCTTLELQHHLTAQENKVCTVRYKSSIPLVRYISAQQLFKNWKHILAPCCFKTTMKSVRCILKVFSAQKQFLISFPQSVCLFVFVFFYHFIKIILTWYLQVDLKFIEQVCDTEL